MSPVVTVARASVALGGRPILRDVDLTVSGGEVVALLGANGSGKSTLVRAMLGLNPLTSGRIDLFDVPIHTFRHWERVGYVPQRSDVAQGVPATVQEVVSSGRMSRRRPLVPAGRTDRVKVREAIEAVGLGERAKHTVSTLSGGQQQRVLIARMLAGEPDLLVLDEPTAGVDAQSQRAIAEALGALTSAGATMVVVLHELGELEPLIGRAVLMRDGRVALDGHPTEVLAAAEPVHHHDEGDRFEPTLTRLLDGRD